MTRVAAFEFWVAQDLTQKIVVRHQESVTFTGDADSNVIGVRVFRYGEQVDLTGATVTANVIRSDGATVTLTGTADGNAVSVSLSSNCLAIAGAIGVYIRVKVGDVQTTVFGGVFTVVSTDTGSIIDPGTIIPSIDALIAELQEKIAYLDRLENFAVTVTTLQPGTSATASVTQTDDTTTLALGIPQGAKGDTGNTGPTGPVAAFSIGTVTTLAAGADATATITGTDAAPVLNLGIPQGAKGDTGPQGPSASIDDSTTGLATTWSSSKIDSEIDGLIADAVTSQSKTWSSSRIAEQIDDSDTTSVKTWSSEKISSELDDKLDADKLEYDITPCKHVVIGDVCIAWGTATCYKNATLFTDIYAGLFVGPPVITATWYTDDILPTETYGPIRIGGVTANGFNTKAGSSNPSSAKPIAWTAIGVAATQSVGNGGGES